MGAIALFFWSTVALLIVMLGNIPLFEIQCVTFLTCFCIAIIKLMRTKNWQAVFKVPLFLWVISILCIYGHNSLFILSLKHAPPEKADLINYLWPIMVILGSSFLPTERLRWPHILGAFIAFSGVFLLLTDGHGLIALELEYWLGYLFALLGAICWTTFTLVSRSHPNTPKEMVGLYCGFGAIFAIFAHTNFETFIMPDLSQAMILLLMGVTSQGLAYFLWDYGVKQGHYQTLCVASYANPIVSIALLVVFGYAQMSIYLFTAALMVTIGALIASNQFGRLFFNPLKNIFISQKSTEPAVSSNVKSK